MLNLSEDRLGPPEAPLTDVECRVLYAMEWVIKNALERGFSYAFPEQGSVRRQLARAVVSAVNKDLRWQVMYDNPTHIENNPS